MYTLMECILKKVVSNFEFIDIAKSPKVEPVSPKSPLLKIPFSREEVALITRFADLGEFSFSCELTLKQRILQQTYGNY